MIAACVREGSTSTTDCLTPPPAAVFGRFAETIILLVSRLAAAAPANEVAGRSLQRFRRPFERLLRNLQHVADLIHEQAHGAVVGLHDDVDGRFTARPF